jgi:tetratricopeptide (TPR) repeat protein
VAARAVKSAPAREARGGKSGSNGHHKPRLDDVVRVFESALALFNRGEFAAARNAFQKIVVLNTGQTEVVARCNMYLAVCRRRTQPAATMPKTPDSLYDQGIVEINRGRFDTAISLFEKALKARPSRPGHVLYALAAAQVRSGRIEEGLRNLERAMESQGVHRSQARQDPDFATVWSHARFLEIVGDPYEMW